MSNTINQELKNIIDEVSNLDNIRKIEVEYNNDSIVFKGNPCWVDFVMFEIIHRAAKENVDGAVDFMCNGWKSSTMWKDKQGNIYHSSQVDITEKKYSPYIEVKFEDYTIE